MLAVRALELIAQLIRTDQPELVLELGSGRSTPAFADAVANYGGRLVSLEHDAHFYEQTRQWLGLHSNVDLRFAPIENGWYARSGWDDLDGINLLIVDGPPNPADDPTNTRAPALPLLTDRLASDATVVVDDTQRAKESEIVAQWIQDYRLDVVRVLTPPGGDELTVLRRSRC
jgi:hypothetical protein